MSGESMVREAKKQLELRRLSHLREAQKKKDELYASVPRLAEIEREIAATGSAVGKSIFLSPDKVKEAIEGLRLRMEALKEERGAMVYFGHKGRNVWLGRRLYGRRVSGTD